FGFPVLEQRFRVGSGPGRGDRVVGNQSARFRRILSSSRPTSLGRKDRSSGMYRSTFPMLAACAGLLLSALQPPVAHAEPKPSYVRKVDFSSIPKQAWQAERARRIGEDLYPQVCSLLADGKTDFPRKFDIYLKRKL